MKVPVAQFWETVSIGINMQREEIYFPGSVLFISLTLELELPAIEQIQASLSYMCSVFTPVNLFFPYKCCPTAFRHQYLGIPRWSSCTCTFVATLNGGHIFTPNLGMESI